MYWRESCWREKGSLSLRISTLELTFAAPIVQMEDLRHSLLYFIRKPIEPRLAILSDAIAANHHLMILMDWCNRLHDIQLDVRQHLRL